MKHLQLVFLSLLLANPAMGQKNDLSVKSLSSEYKYNPLGIDEVKPRLSWKIVTSMRNTLQTAYEIRAAHNVVDLAGNRNLIWKTGKVPSGQSIQIPYSGKPLKSFDKVFWQVRIWDNHKRVSPWSEPASWEMGITDMADWKAEWISPDIKEDKSTPQPCPYLRKEFRIHEDISEARLYISSQGLYQAEINGQRVGNQEFTPGWTSYRNRIQYQTYDVTSLLKSSDNAMGVMLGDGWFRGYLAWQDNRNVYGTDLSAIAMLRIIHKNGSVSFVSTDDTWKSSTGPLLKSDIYNGETYDARLELKGWSTAVYDDKDWHKTLAVDRPKNTLVAPPGPPVKKIQELKPISVSVTADGSYLVDMGQNMVGWIKIKATGKPGERIMLKHAEVLDKRGRIYYDNLRSAKQTNTYILKGGAEEEFEPHFTFQGFRYLEVIDYPGKLTADKITGIVIHSDMEPAGSFSCSDSLINQLQHNIVWGQKGNFLDVPTDCPQRDERLGWTGDAQVFAPTACFNMNTAGFYTKWLRDLAADQGKDGKVPHVIPDILGDGGATGWADAAIIIPWTVYIEYADTNILRAQYPSMKKWVEYMTNRAGDDHVWDENWHFGDWLSFDDSSPAYMGAYTSTDLIATAYFAYSTRLLAKIAAVLGNTSDASHYNALSDKIKAAFQKDFSTPAGRLVSHTQTAYTLALAFDLLDNMQKTKAASFLARDVEKFNHITTGFLGTPLICKTLTDNGHIDLAYKLLTRKEYPSWLYPVRMGATTIWERWDGMKPDSTFQDVGMNSFNHYAYGAIGKWMYEVVAGLSLDPDKPGYNNVVINPRPGGGITWADTYHESLYGRVATSWRTEGKEFIMKVNIPPNTTASLIIPGGAKKASVDQKPLSAWNTQKDESTGNTLLPLGSGQYEVRYGLE